MQDNVREPFLVALAVAAERGEAPLQIGTLKRRVQRGRLSRRLIQATAEELQREGLVDGTGGTDSRIKLSARGQRWIAGRFEVAPNGKFTEFAPRVGSSDLPPPSDDYRRHVRREAWLTLGVAIAPLILIGVLIVVLR